MGTVRTSSSGKGWILNVCDFGAKGDGNAATAAAETAAIQAALTAAQSLEQATVYFPAGRYVINAQLTYNVSSATAADRRLTIRGDGQYTTELKFTSATAGSRGLAITTGAHYRHRIQIQDLALTTTYDTGGTAIAITYPTMTESVYEPQVIIERVGIHAFDSTGNYNWATGISLVYTWAFRIAGCTLGGATSGGVASGQYNSGVTGISLGAYGCMDGTIENCWFYVHATGITDGGTLNQGLHVRDCTFIGQQDGIALSGAGSSFLEVSGCHLTTVRYGITATNWDFCQIHDNLIYRRDYDADDADFVGINLGTSSVGCSRIHHNYIESVNNAGAAPEGSLVGISTNSARTVITGNIIRDSASVDRGSSGIYSGSSAYYTLVHGNICSGLDTGISHHVALDGPPSYITEADNRDDAI